MAQKYPHGVSYHKKRKKYLAIVHITLGPGKFKSKTVGSYDTVGFAAAAVTAYELSHPGEFLKYPDAQERAPTGALADSNTLNQSGVSITVGKGRSIMNAKLSDPAVIDIAFNAYVAQLKSGNPFLLKDYMDRIAGKVKETVDLSNSDGSLRPLIGVDVAQLAQVLLSKRQELLSQVIDVDPTDPGTD